MQRALLKRPARWIAALVLLAVISSAALLLAGAGHHCSGQGCRVCEALEQSAKQLSLLFLPLAGLFGGVCRPVVFRAARRVVFQGELSPVRMRVRMND